jgi:hypothetical protein
MESIYLSLYNESMKNTVQVDTILQALAARVVLLVLVATTPQVLHPLVAVPVWEAVTVTVLHPDAPTV